MKALLAVSIKTITIKICSKPIKIKRLTLIIILTKRLLCHQEVLRLEGNIKK